MTPVPRYLLDVSGVIRMAQPGAAERVGPLLADGLVATCAVVELRLFAGLRDPTRLAEVRQARSAALAWLPTEDRDLARALEIQAALLGQGLAVAWVAFVVAAVAQRHQVTVLHYDAAFDAIAKQTGQPVEWLP
jgi:predicted nucleic acid-binding protein